MSQKANVNQFETMAYKLYADETNPQRATPNVYDGMKLVQRRYFYLLLHDAPASFKKGSWFAGTLIANYHPHGDMSAFDTLARMVRSCPGLIAGQGSWGHDFTLTGEKEAAARYVECGRGILFKDYFKYAHMSKMVKIDGDLPEPKYFIVPIPFGLMAGSAGIGTGEGFNIRIPPYKLSDLIKRLKHLLNGGDPDEEVIIPNYGDFEITGDIKKVLKEGTGQILLRGKYKVNKKKKAIYITSKPPWVKEKAFFRIFKKVWDVIEINDFTEKRKTNIEIKLKKQKTTTLEDVESLVKKIVSLKINFHIKLHEHPDVYHNIGVDEWILNTFNTYKKAAILDKENKIEALKKELDLMHVLEKFIPLYKKNISSIKSIKEYDAFKKFVITELSIDDETFKKISSMQTATILKRRLNTDRLTQKIKNLKEDIKNIHNVVLAEYDHLLKLSIQTEKGSVL